MTPHPLDTFRPSPSPEPKALKGIVEARRNVDPALQQAWEAFHGDATRSSTFRKEIAPHLPHFNPDLPLGKELVEIHAKATEAVRKSVIAHGGNTFEQLALLAANAERDQRILQEREAKLGVDETTRRTTMIREALWRAFPEIIDRTLRTMDRYATLRQQFPSVARNAALEQGAVLHMQRLGGAMQWMTALGQLNLVSRNPAEPIPEAKIKSLLEQRGGYSAVMQALVKERTGTAATLIENPGTPAGKKQIEALRKNSEQFLKESDVNWQTLNKILTAGVVDRPALQKALVAVTEDSIEVLVGALNAYPDPASELYLDFLNRFLDSNVEESTNVGRQPRTSTRDTRLDELRKQRVEYVRELNAYLRVQGDVHIDDIEEMLTPEARVKFEGEAKIKTASKRSAEQLEKGRKAINAHVDHLMGSFRSHFNLVLEGDTRRGEAGILTSTWSLVAEDLWNEGGRMKFVSMVGFLVQMRAWLRPGTPLRLLLGTADASNESYRVEVMGPIMRTMGLPESFNPLLEEDWRRLTPSEMKSFLDKCNSVLSNIRARGKTIRDRIEINRSDLNILDGLRQRATFDTLQGVEPDADWLGKPRIEDVDLKSLPIPCVLPADKGKLLAAYLVLYRQMRIDWRSYTQIVGELAEENMKVLGTHVELGTAASDAARMTGIGADWIEWAVFGGVWVYGGRHFWHGGRLGVANPLRILNAPARGVADTGRVIRWGWNRMRGPSSVTATAGAETATAFETRIGNILPRSGVNTMERFGPTFRELQVLENEVRGMSDAAARARLMEALNTRRIELIEMAASRTFNATERALILALHEENCLNRAALPEILRRMTAAGLAEEGRLLVDLGAMGINTVGVPAPGTPTFRPTLRRPVVAEPTSMPSLTSETRLISETRAARAFRGIAKFGMRTLLEAHVIEQSIELAGQLKEFVSLTAGERRKRLVDEISSAMDRAVDSSGNRAFRRGSDEHTWVHVESGFIVNAGPILNVTDAELMAVTIDMIASAGSITGAVVGIIYLNNPVGWTIGLASMLILPPVRLVTDEIRGNSAVSVLMDLPPLISANIPVTSIFGIPYEEIEKRLNDSRGEAGISRREAYRRLRFNLVIQEVQRMSPIPLSYFNTTSGGWINRFWEARDRMIWENTATTGDRYGDPEWRTRGARRIASALIREFMAQDYRRAREELQKLTKQRDAMNEAIPASPDTKKSVEERRKIEARMEFLNSRMRVIGSKMYNDGITVAEAVETSRLLDNFIGSPLYAMYYNDEPERFVPHEFAQVTELSGAIQLRVFGAKEEMRYGIPCFVLERQGAGNRDVLFAFISGHWYCRVDGVGNKWLQSFSSAGGASEAAVLALSAINHIEDRLDEDKRVTAFLTTQGFTQQIREGRNVFVKRIRAHAGAVLPTDHEYELLVSKINGVWFYRSPSNPTRWAPISSDPSAMVHAGFELIPTAHTLSADGPFKQFRSLIIDVANLQSSVREEAATYRETNNLFVDVMTGVGENPALLGPLVPGNTLFRSSIFESSSPALSLYNNLRDGPGVVDACRDMTANLLQRRPDTPRMILYRHIPDVVVSHFDEERLPASYHRNCEVIVATAVYSNALSLEVGGMNHVVAIRARGSTSPFVICPGSAVNGSFEKRSYVDAQRLLKESFAEGEKERAEKLTASSAPEARLYCLASVRADQPRSMVIRESPREVAIVHDQGAEAWMYLISTDPLGVRRVNLSEFFGRGGPDLSLAERSRRMANLVAAPTGSVMRQLTDQQMKFAGSFYGEISSRPADNLPMPPEVLRALSSIAAPAGAAGESPVIQSAISMLRPRLNPGPEVSKVVYDRLWRFYMEHCPGDSMLSYLSFMQGMRTTLNDPVHAAARIESESDIDAFLNFVSGNIPRMGP